MKLSWVDRLTISSWSGPCTLAVLPTVASGELGPMVTVTRLPVMVTTLPAVELVSRGRVVTPEDGEVEPDVVSLGAVGLPEPHPGRTTPSVASDTACPVWAQNERRPNFRSAKLDVTIRPHDGLSSPSGWRGSRFRRQPRTP